MTQVSQAPIRSVLLALLLASWITLLEIAVNRFFRSLDPIEFGFYGEAVLLYFALLALLFLPQGLIFRRATAERLLTLNLLAWVMFQLVLGLSSSQDLQVRLFGARLSTWFLPLAYLGFIAGNLSARRLTSVGGPFIDATLFATGSMLVIVLALFQGFVVEEVLFSTGITLFLPLAAISLFLFGGNYLATRFFPGDRRGLLFLGGAMGLLAILLYPRREPSLGSPGTEPRRNVLLIVVDTLRADHLGCYGYPHAATPAIDGLARQGILYRNAFANGPWTLPSFGSILTGRYPGEHGAGWHERGGNVYSSLRRDVPTLAEVLREHGYVTGAITSNFQLSPRFGFDRGFDHYDNSLGRNGRAAVFNFLSNYCLLDIPPYMRAKDIARKANASLERYGGQPFFLMVHFMDPHLPYDPPSAYSSDSADLVSRYDGEISYTDAMLGRVIQQIMRQGLLERTVILITSDHGEELGEGRMTDSENPTPDHGHSLYDEILRVPLILWIPDGDHLVIEELVESVQIAPTILTLLGLGNSVLAHGNPLPPFGAEAKQFVFSEGTLSGSEKKAVRSATHKLIFNPTHLPDEALELYDVRSDPEERLNLLVGGRSGEDVEGIVTQMMTHLEKILGEESRARQLELDTRFTQRELEVLRALGYVQK